MVYALLASAEWRLADGLLAEADSLAALALQAATLDSLTGGRSAHAGRAELVRARVAVARGDATAAHAAAVGAMSALANGFGPTHRPTLEARALADALR